MMSSTVTSSPRPPPPTFPGLAVLLAVGVTFDFDALVSQTIAKLLAIALHQPWPLPPTKLFL